MSYKELQEVTGMGKVVTHRNKDSRIPFVVGVVQDEISVSDGEQKYFVHLIRLAENVSCEGDPTRHVLRIGYYTQRTDGWFCLGSQFAPTFTPAELKVLVEAIYRKGWLLSCNAEADTPIQFDGNSSPV